ncbi:MAG: glycosyl hydrolase family 57 [Candidatus Omnitrophota bacterium]
MSPEKNIVDIIDGWPNVCGEEGRLLKPSDPKKSLFSSSSNIHFKNVQSSFGIALHMHQPTIPASTDDISTAGLISNLQHMMEHQNIGDNHNAPVFRNCYSRISDIVRELVGQGRNPRVMLDYSGNLFWGLRQMGEGGVLDNLRLITTDKTYQRYVEWLGTMWSHAVVTSTPVPDIKLHIMAWRHHFASVFGPDALMRVKGFSAPEMHLPIHPDVCYQYVKTLKECGYEWLMVQEHTVENPDGSGIRRPHFPHRLVAKNSLGEVAEITVLIKTQGSDTKLVAQMQPYYEAKVLGRQEYAGQDIPPFVCQIGDGENGGVMMNEFPPCYRQAFQEIGTEGVVGMNGSEYLEFLKGIGMDAKSFAPIQPISQHRIWEKLKTYSPGAADQIIEKVKETDKNFNLDKGSWTNDKNWVKGYEDVMDPINALSVAFHKTFDDKKIDRGGHQYREALIYLLLSQTSCFRYWGSGLWTEYAKEICRRGMQVLAVSKKEKR